MNYQFLDDKNQPIEKLLIEVRAVKGNLEYNSSKTWPVEQVLKYIKKDEFHSAYLVVVEICRWAFHQKAQKDSCISGKDVLDYLGTFQKEQVFFPSGSTMQLRHTKYLVSQTLKPTDQYNEGGYLTYRIPGESFSNGEGQDD